MSQHDFEIANQGFPSFRSDLNSGLQALASNSAGATEPSSTYAYQFWYDSTANLLKMRNTDDDAWITLAYFDQTNDEWEVRSAVIQAVDAAGVVIKTDDGTTRIEVQDDGDVSIDSGTLFVDATNNRVGVGTSSPLSKLHIEGGDSGASVFTDTYFSVENSGNTRIAILSGTSNIGGIKFGDSGLNRQGGIDYDHSDDSMRFATTNTERMRIDSSGNLLVGTTDNTLYANSGTGNGIALLSAGELDVARNAVNVVLNRLATDGDIIQFRKDGTKVGSIGTASNDLTIFSTASSHGGFRFQSGGTIPVNNSGALADNSFDIGASAYRFKDLYLSGGVYLGGTGAANYLDDYEEGTWTPASGGGTAGTAYYTKIGNMVTIYGDITFSGVTSATFAIGGIPFTPNIQTAISIAYTNIGQDVSGITTTSGFFNVYNQQQSVVNVTNGARFIFTGTYRTSL